MNGFIAGLGAVLVVLIVLFFSTTSVSVDPGEEIVMIDRPIMFGHEGVRPETLKEGREYIWESTKTYRVPTIPITYHVNFDDLATSDNVMLDFESALQLQITDPIKIVTKFGPDWFKNNVQSTYMNIVRDVVKTVTMSQIISDAAVSKRIDDEVAAALTAELKSKGVPVNVMSTLLGRGKPNQKVLDSINATAAEQQRKQTIIASTAAEKERELNEKQRAISDKAYNNQMGFSTEQFVELEKTRINADACSKSKSCVLIAGSNGVQPVLPVQ